MAAVSYKVVKRGDLWSVLRDGEASVGYFTREAAFEVAFAEASGDLRYGRDIVIEVMAVDSKDEQTPDPEQFDGDEAQSYVGEHDDHLGADSVNGVSDALSMK